jgi:hypothetical protein
MMAKKEAPFPEPPWGRAAIRPSFHPALPVTVMMMVVVMTVVTIPAMMVVVMVAIGMTEAFFARIVGHPLEDRLAAAGTADHFIGGIDGGATVSVTDKTAWRFAFWTGGDGGGKETDTGEDGEHCFHFGRTDCGSQCI